MTILGVLRWSKNVSGVVLQNIALPPVSFRVTYYVTIRMDGFRPSS